MRTQIDESAGLGESWSHVAVFAAAVDANLDKWLTETYRLGLTEYRALGFLRVASDRELRVSELARRVGLNPSSVTRLVSRLESKGLAVRDVCADDGRGVYAVLSDRGEELVREIDESYGDRLRDVLSRPGVHFPDFDAEAVRSSLGDVRRLVGG